MLGAVLAIAAIPLAGCRDARPPASSSPPSVAVAADARPATADPPAGLAAALDAPVCVGFTASGRGAYVLQSERDPKAPSWSVWLQPLGSDSESTGLLIESDALDRAEIEAALADHAGELEAWRAEQTLRPCHAVTDLSGPIVLHLTGLDVPAVRVVPDGDGWVDVRRDPPDDRSYVTSFPVTREAQELVAVYYSDVAPGIVVVFERGVGDQRGWRSEFLALQ